MPLYLLPPGRKNRTQKSEAAQLLASPKILFHHGGRPDVRHTDRYQGGIVRIITMSTIRPFPYGTLGRRYGLRVQGCEPDAEFWIQIARPRVTRGHRQRGDVGAPLPLMSPPPSWWYGSPAPRRLASLSSSTSWRRA